MNPAIANQFEIRTRHIWLVHCLVAVLLFYPLFTGAFSVAGTDLIFNHYPNLLFGYREFHLHGKFSLWNSYIFAGTDFSGSMQAHYLNPLYWPLFLLPEKYLFHGLTAAFMVCNLLIGLLWTRVAQCLDLKNGGEFMIGLVAQAGMFFWFAMTTMISVSMYLAASYAIYLLLTYSQRNWLKNYIGLSIACAAIFITPHPMYILGFFLPILTLFVVRFFPDSLLQPWRGAVPLFSLAVITAIAVSAYRLVPVAMEIIDKGNLVQNIKAVGEVINAGYLALTLFNPLSWGFSEGDSRLLGQLLGNVAGRHLQNFNALYFGVIPIVIVYIAMRRSLDARLLTLAAIYIALQFSYLEILTPLSDIVYFILFPFAHAGLFRPALTFAFLFLLIAAVRRVWALPLERITSLAGEGLAIGILAIMAWGVMWARAMQGLPNSGAQLINVTRIALLVLLAALIVGVPLVQRHIGRVGLGWTAIALCFILVGAAGGLLFKCGYIDMDEVYARPILNGFLVLLVCLALIGFAHIRGRLQRVIFLTICALFIAVVLLFPVERTFGRGLAYMVWVGISGWASFLAILIAGFIVLEKLGRQNAKPNIVKILIFILLIFDLGAAYRNYSFSNVLDAPFVRTQNLIYPSKTIAQAVDARATAEAQGNLLQNSDFNLQGGALPHWSYGGGAINVCPSSTAVSMVVGQAIEICYPRNDGQGNLFQDVPLQSDVSEAAFGIWVRADAPAAIKLFMTSPPNNSGGALVHHVGDGRWHWLAVHIQFSGDLKVVRPHINMPVAGRVELYAPKLVLGSHVYPEYAPIGHGEIASSSAEKFDMDNFRANRVHIINQVRSNELMSNFAIVAKSPTYGGVDSDLASNFVRFLGTFKNLDPSWFHRAGVYPVLDDARALDLFGVRYDVDMQTGRLLVRPNALPRFAAFSSYQVEPDFSATLSRLKSPAFNPETTLLLDKAPSDAIVEKSNQHWQLLNYDRPDADRLHVKITPDMPRIILFNDRYNEGWQASWNGQKVPLQYANGIFMAVVLPEGAGDLLFDFKPALFYRLVSLAWAVAVALGVLSIFVYIHPLFRRIGARLSAR